MEATRTFFWNVGDVRIAIYILAIIPIAFIVYGIYKRYLLWKQGAEDNRTSHLPLRILSFIKNGLLQKRIFQEAYPGIMHGLIFFGFGILFIGTTLIALQEDVTLPLFHWEYLKGTFYLYYSLILDIFGILAIVGTLMALYRRLVLKPERLDRRWDDNLVLYLLLVILVTGFLVEGFRIHANELPAHPEWSRWSPIGLALASVFKGITINPKISLNLHRFFWWLHIIAAFTFLAIIPYTKLIHIFTGSIDTFLRPDPPTGRLVPIDIENSETFGVEKYSEFTWKHLFDLDACVRCGRCQDVCPAHLSGKPLSPKKFIQDLRAGLPQGLKDEAETPPLVGTIIDEEVLWACTTCRACEEACPLFIEHVPKNIELRRYQVLVQTRFPSELRTTFRNLERYKNPWGVPKSQRDEWTQGLDVPIFSADISEKGYLLWIGCACSVDENNIKTAIAMVKLLKAAGVPFGILGKQEGCCGEPARRLGNEYVFQLEAEQNIGLFNELGVKRIITLCPHGYHVFKNEYPDFGGHFEVYHYTEIIQEIMDQLPLYTAPTSQPVTYHDPCYLGRYNGIYEAPRKVIQKAGGTLSEMAHHRERSLCCGGGGGHIWMEEQMGQRISHLRIGEAVQCNCPIVLTACPHCMTMLTDGAKERELSNKIEVVDIAQWLESRVKRD